MKLSDYAVVSDFDGTITIEDSNDLLVHNLGNDRNAQIEIDFCAGRMGNREAMLQHFDAMRITAQEYKDFISANINIDEYFDNFLEYIRSQDIPFFVVSAGFRQGIEEVLGRKRLEGVEIFANDLLGEPHVSPIFTHANPACSKSFGPCGNCKQVCIDIIRRRVNRKIIFIGDGLTDRCVVEKVDLLFAKHHLAQYCDENALPYQLYQHFSDVTNYLKNL